MGSAIIVLFSCFLAAANAATETTYTAAVVEFQPIGNATFSEKERINANVDEYIRILSEIEQDLDVIVYPESILEALTLDLLPQVPDVAEGVVPCGQSEEDFPEFFRKLSCAAASHDTYLVVNLVTKSICNETTQLIAGDERPCGNNGYNLYNTDVAFDRKGTIVGRYRKYHLFGEYPLNTTVTPDVTRFETDFGVTFGVFTCFDVLFEVPSLALTRMNVTNIIFPTMWFGELPFLTALQAQDMFARANDVNFLASGANNPAVGSGGSGVFQGAKGAVVEDVVATGGTKVYIASIGKTPEVEGAVVVDDVEDVDQEAKEMDGFFLLREQLDSYSSLPLSAAEGVDELEFCNEPSPDQKLCCVFNVKFTKSEPTTENYYSYRFVVINGVRSFSGVYNGGIEVCGIIACLNDSLSSCGSRFSDYSTVSWPIRFDSVKIVANFTDISSKMQYPNSVLSSMRPLKAVSTIWSSQTYEEEELVERSFELVEPQDRLMTFAIYGRDFSRDFDPNESGSQSWHQGLGLAVLGVIAMMVHRLM